MFKQILKEGERESHVGVWERCSRQREPPVQRPRDRAVFGS